MAEVIGEDSDVEPELELYSEFAGRDVRDYEVDVLEERFSISDLVAKLDAGRIQVPPFQRYEVWDLKRRSQFIESILLLYPLPPFFMNRDRRSRHLIIDGLQRMSSIYRFRKDEFALVGLERLTWLNGSAFSELPEELQARIEDRQMICWVLKPNVPQTVVYDIFYRINTGGVPLSRQEIRNALNQGPGTELLRRLADWPPFRDWLGHRLNPIRMGDEEAILRCISFSLIDPATEYKGDMDPFLTGILQRLNRETPEQLVHIEATFKRIVTEARHGIGDDVFRNWFHERAKINLAIMESVYRYIKVAGSNWSDAGRDQLRQRYWSMLRDDAFERAIRYSTGGTGAVKTRFERAASHLRGTHAD